jgi:hypothetical protein
VKFDLEFRPDRFVIRYAIGNQVQEVLVEADGATLDEFLTRLERFLNSPSPEPLLFLRMQMAGGGQVAIRIDSIVAIEAQHKAS